MKIFFSPIFDDFIKLKFIGLLIYYAVSILMIIILNKRKNKSSFTTLQNKKKKRSDASAGNRTRVNCLEGSYADHYTTDALLTLVLPKAQVFQQKQLATCSWVLHIPNNGLGDIAQW